MKKGMLHLDPAWASFALSSFNILIEIFLKECLLNFFYQFSFIQHFSALSFFELRPFDLRSFVLRSSVPVPFCHALFWQGAYTLRLVSHFWLLLSKSHFLKRKWAIGFVSTLIWDFLKISQFPKILSLKSFGNPWGNFAILNIKFCFTCGESDLHLNIVKFQNIMIRIAGSHMSVFFSKF